VVRGWGSFRATHAQPAIRLQAYGQAGTGKTRMMEGTEVDPGLLPRIVSELFAIRKQHGLVMSLSFVEVSGNTVRDATDAVVLKTAQVDDAHVRMGVVDQSTTREVLGYSDDLQLNRMD
jgi:hypothetical protein